jgi:hypothetical protein
VVWLDPLKSGGWKFSSAYKPLASQIIGIPKIRDDNMEVWEKMKMPRD